MACSRSIHARAGSRVAADCHGILLYSHLLGDLARHETPVPHDFSTRVSPRNFTPTIRYNVRSEVVRGSGQSCDNPKDR